jgi:uncharacterized protein YdeI (YjbR/CyaY-like superfamily)
MKMPKAGQDIAQIEVTSRAALRAWLKAHHTQTESMWLVTWKKSDARNVPYGAIVEELLCVGWVDSLPRKLDESRTMLLISPRKPKSAWSKVNKERVERLIAAGKMLKAGIAKVEDAKASGTWNALDAVEALEVPPDLERAFATRKGAKANWDAFPRSVKRGILEWILQAKKPETREKRVTETADKAALNERANQWRQ